MLSVISLILNSLVSVTDNPVVRIGQTNIVGINSGASNMVEFFGGIPFAEPPLGPLRLNMPVLATSIKGGTLNAQTSGPGCLQAPPPPNGVSEDCLTLDIYRPAGISSESTIPVLAWIYGGGFVVGASSFYNATNIVEESIARGTPIMFVGINYRVGPLGFPQGFEAGQRNITNLGLHDQLAGLEWIQQNIHHFGGDKSKVTVAGESAGAGSIIIHFLRPKIKSLARAAIVESTGSGTAYMPERNEANWQQYVAAIPACQSYVGTNDTFDCIRRADSSSLQEALILSNLQFGNSSFRGVIDGPDGLIPDRPSQITPEGNLPILLGSNLDEGALFTPQSTDSTEEIRNVLTALYTPPVVSPQILSDTIERALQMYPDIPVLGSPFGTGNDTFGLSSQYKRYAAIWGDLMFHSSRRTLSQQVSEAGLPVFAYHFSDHDAVAFGEFAPSSAAPGSLGVPHTSEIPYVLGRLMNKTEGSSILSTLIQNYWISFVNGLDPNDGNGQKRPKWPRYTPNEQVLLELNGPHPVPVPDVYRTEQISLWQDNPDVLLR